MKFYNINTIQYKNLLVLFVGDGLVDKFLFTGSGPTSGLVIFTIPARPSNSFLLWYKQTKKKPKNYILKKKKNNCISFEFQL